MQPRSYSINICLEKVLKWSDIKTFKLMTAETISGERNVCNHRFQIYNFICYRWMYLSKIK